MLKVCLNGGVSRADHPAVPVTPAELAADAVASAAAGAAAVHLHPRDHTGRETLAAQAVADALLAVRRAAPGLPVGVSTGAWIAPDPAARLAAVRSWRVLPDFASVNVHEDGSETIATALYERGVGVEAGVWTVDAVTALGRWRVPCLRMLVECMNPAPSGALADAGRMLTALREGSPARAADGRAAPILLHAEGPAVWVVLGEAVRRGLDTRIGLEDARTLPDGTPAAGNAALVTAAVALGAG